MKLILFCLLITGAAHASDPVRPATDEEISKADSQLELSMNLEKAMVNNAKAPDELYGKLGADGNTDYLGCVENEKTLKFKNSVLRVLFSVERQTKNKSLSVSSKFQPDQINDRAKVCIEDKLKSLYKLANGKPRKVTGELVYHYSKPLKYDSVK